MKYYSINFYLVSEKESKVWIENDEAENDKKAENLLSSNNAQIILNEKEFRKLFEEMKKIITKR